MKVTFAPLPISDVTVCVSGVASPVRVGIGTVTGRVHVRERSEPVGTRGAIVTAIPVGISADCRVTGVRIGAVIHTVVIGIVGQIP